jgi:hypothetical protein
VQSPWRYAVSSSRLAFSRARRLRRVAFVTARQEIQNETISQKRNATIYDPSIIKTKGHAGITPHGLCETVLQALQRFHLGAYSVQMEVPV